MNLRIDEMHIKEETAQTTVNGEDDFSKFPSVNFENQQV